MIIIIILFNALKLDFPPRYKCGMCICEYKDADALGSHLRIKHNTGASNKNYHSNIILLSATHHHCLVCGARLLRNRFEIRVHMRMKHKMKFLDYQAFRMKLLGEENVVRDKGGETTEENTRQG